MNGSGNKGRWCGSKQTLTWHANQVVSNKQMSFNGGSYFKLYIYVSKWAWNMIERS